jgi:hypothetical protein
LIRWGKADILNPTDRFAPREYLNVVDNDFLGITAARLTYATTSNSLDLVWVPRLTPRQPGAPLQLLSCLTQEVKCRMPKVGGD